MRPSLARVVVVQCCAKCSVVSVFALHFVDLLRVAPAPFKLFPHRGDMRLTVDPSCWRKILLSNTSSLSRRSCGDLRHALNPLRHPPVLFHVGSHVHGLCSAAQ